MHVTTWILKEGRQGHALTHHSLAILHEEDRVHGTQVMIVILHFFALTNVVSEIEKQHKISKQESFVVQRLACQLWNDLSLAQE